MNIKDLYEEDNSIDCLDPEVEPEPEIDDTFDFGDEVDEKTVEERIAEDRRQLAIKQLTAMMEENPALKMMVRDALRVDLINAWKDIEEGKSTLDKKTQKEVKETIEAIYGKQDKKIEKDPEPTE